MLMNVTRVYVHPISFFKTPIEIKLDWHVISILLNSILFCSFAVIAISSWCWKSQGEWNCRPCCALYRWWDGRNNSCFCHVSTGSCEDTPSSTGNSIMLGWLKNCHELGGLMSIGSQIRFFVLILLYSFPFETLSWCSCFWTLQRNTIYYRGILHAFHTICREEGFLGLYKGLGATLLVSFCYTSLFFIFLFLLLLLFYQI